VVSKGEGRASGDKEDVYKRQNSNGTETTIASGLKKLDDQVHQAQQAAGSGENGRGQQDLGAETAALDLSLIHILSLEDFKVQPGDVVSLYATAKDNHAETKTDISFIQVDPFEREFSQSQSGGGGGGGGGGNRAQNQTDISKREKELIAATWKQINSKGVTPQAAAATGKLLSEAQMTLKDQALALSARMQSRDLASANEEFNSFDKDMELSLIHI